MKYVLFLVMLILDACSESRTPDYSDCIQDTPDYDLLLTGPIQDKDVSYNWVRNGVGLVVSVDSLVDPWKYGQFHGVPSSISETGNQDNQFMVQRTYFGVCNKQFDTCYFSSLVAGSAMNGSSTYNEFYHKDTLDWGGYNWFSSGGGTLLCRLDQKGGIYLQDGVDDYDFRFVKSITLLDTASDPAYRSIYQQWWPLPRNPWPKGESVIADSTIWADSVADSLEVWTYPWRHNNQDEFVEFPL